VTSGFWQDRPVLVTGATGLLGAWLSKRLFDLGADLVCLVRDWVPQSELSRSRTIERVRVVRGDVREAAVVERALNEYEIDTAFHLAAQTIVPIANRNPVSTFESNVAGTWTVLEACRRVPTVKQIVLASSDKAYGDQESLPYTEDAPLEGLYPYDVSKSCADLIAQTYGKFFEVPVAITRCGNLFGGGDLNWSRLIPGTIRSILRGARPVIRSDGGYVRDYFYVEDAAFGNILLAERLAEDRALTGEAFNLSYEVPMSVVDVVKTILRLMGSTLEPDIRNEATGEIRKQFLRAEKARARLGWTPLFTLDEGLERSIEWYRALLARGE
jgi:CDP-glucose 4,6-dehydratase